MSGRFENQTAEMMLGCVWHIVDDSQLWNIVKNKLQGFWPSFTWFPLEIEYQKTIWMNPHSYGDLSILTGYKWDYIFYKWGYKYL